MLLHHFTSDGQRESFYVLAHKLTMCDGEDAPEEEEALRRMKAEMGGTAKAPMDRILGPVDVSAFDNDPVRVAAMLELLALVYTDDYLHEAESALIGEIAAAFGFDQDALDIMVEWAWRVLDARRARDGSQRSKLLAEAQQLMGVAA